MTAEEELIAQFSIPSLFCEKVVGLFYEDNTERKDKTAYNP